MHLSNPVQVNSGQGVRGCEVGICVTVSAMVDVRALSRRMVKALRHAPVGEGGWLPVSWLATTYGCSEAEILAAAGSEGSPGKTRFRNRGPRVDHLRQSAAGP